MFIYNEDKTITIKCSDGKFRTFSLEEIDFDKYIGTGEIKKFFEFNRDKSDCENFC
jgi:hypothetical protein